MHTDDRYYLMKAEEERVGVIVGITQGSGKVAIDLCMLCLHLLRAWHFNRALIIRTCNALHHLQQVPWSTAGGQQGPHHPYQCPAAHPHLLYTLTSAFPAAQLHDDACKARPCICTSSTDIL